MIFLYKPTPNYVIKALKRCRLDHCFSLLSPFRYTKAFVGDCDALTEGFLARGLKNDVAFKFCIRSRFVASNPTPKLVNAAWI